jgi:hypothetical protein
MYTDEDLDSAVRQGIFTEASVKQFREQAALLRNSPAVDEENFRLVSGFNDIFVVIACGLLLFSAKSALGVFGSLYGELAVPVLSWGLAEYFVRKRKMALPAIILLLTFVGGIFSLGVELFSSSDKQQTYMLAAAMSAIAALTHYRRFRVPITVAAGTASIIGVVVTGVLAYFPEARNLFLVFMFLSGIAAFIYAMYWDASDTQRQTRRSDVAFWLHLLAAPLIVHPVFNFLGIFDGRADVNSMITVIVLYVLMTLISIIVDRRAFMVSSLAYVLYAISNLLEAFGAVSYSFAVTGVCIGAALLLLSAFWHPVRQRLVLLLPASLQRFVPVR